MAATVRKIQEGHEQSLNQLIDQAGKINAEKTALDKAYKELRDKIELELQKRDGRVEVFGQEFKATYDNPTSQVVDVKELAKKKPSIFWRLATVPVSVLNEVLGKEEANEFIDLHTSETRRLNISAIKKSK